MIKLSVNEVIKTLDGEPIKNEKAEVITVKTIMVNALCSSFEDEKGLDNVEKMNRWVLAKKVNGTKDALELSVEDASKIKTLVFKGYGLVIAGYIADLIDGVKE